MAISMTRIMCINSTEAAQLRVRRISCIQHVVLHSQKDAEENQVYHSAWILREHSVTSVTAHRASFRYLEARCSMKYLGSWSFKSLGAAKGNLLYTNTPFTATLTILITSFPHHSARLRFTAATLEMLLLYLIPGDNVATIPVWSWLEPSIPILPFLFSHPLTIHSKS